MGKKHKHEEHVNHERWVISFADMMTLLFALFVVLYAMGQTDLAKLKKLKKSIQFAFAVAGSGKTQDTGIFDQVKGQGDTEAPAPLITAQDGAMREFLKDELEDFKEQVGKSLEINQTDDSVSISAPLSDFFEPNRPDSIRPKIAQMLDRTVDGSLTFTSTIRVRIEAPELPVAKDRTGTVITSRDISYRRLRTLTRAVNNNPQVLPHMVSTEFNPQKDKPGSRGDWERQARVFIYFSNTRPENR
ncbi:MAG: chemotaxis protein MotB [Planctomycetota bacterium]|jgi:chemotaxis protein MotB